MKKHIILLIIAILFNSIALAYTTDEYKIDPIPYLKMFDDYLSYVLIVDLTNVNKLYESAMNIDFNDPKLLLAHRDAYKLYHDITNTLHIIDSLSMNITFSTSHNLSTTVKKLYEKIIIYDNLIDEKTMNYIKKLEEYTHSRSVFFKFKNSIIEKMNNIHKLLSRYASQLEEIYSSITSITHFGRLKIYIQDIGNIPAGSIIHVLARINTSKSTMNLSYKKIHILCSLLIGSYYENIENYTIINDTHIRLTIKIPEARILEDKQVSIIRDLNTGTLYVYARLMLKIMIITANESMTGTIVKDFHILVYLPKIRIETPSYVYVNSLLAIKVYSYVDKELNLSIYLDNLHDSKSILLNTTIHPGENIIRLDTSNITPGYHTLFYYIPATEYYLSVIRSSAIAIIYKTVSAVVSLPNTLFGPPFTIDIRGRVYDNVRYKIIVKVDDITVYEDISNDKNIYLIINAPTTLSSLLIWFRRIDVYIIPLDKSYQPAVFTVNALSVNALFILILLLLMGLIYLHPLISEPLINFPLWVKQVILTSRKRLSRSLKITGITGLSTRYRTMRSRRYYRIFIKTLSILTEPIKDEETLREYINRITDRLPSSIREYVFKLSLLFEEDMYSNHEIDINKVKKYLKNLIEEIKK